MPSINLIPPEMLNHRRRARRGRRWLLGIGVAYTLALVPWLREEQAKAHLAESQAVMGALDLSLAEMRGAARDSQGRLVSLESEWQRAQQLRAKRTWSSVMDLVIKALPADVWLETVSTDPAVPQPTAANKTEGLIGRDGPRRLVLAGYATQIEALFAFERALRTVDEFKIIHLAAVQEATVNGVQVTRFTAECAW